MFIIRNKKVNDHGVSWENNKWGIDYCKDNGMD